MINLCRQIAFLLEFGQSIVFVFVYVCVLFCLFVCLIFGLPSEPVYEPQRNLNHTTLEFRLVWIQKKYYLFESMTSYPIVNSEQLYYFYVLITSKELLSTLYLTVQGF